MANRFGYLAVPARGSASPAKRRKPARTTPTPPAPVAPVLALVRPTLAFSVPGKSISVNATYKVTRSGRFYKNPAVVEYQKRVYAVAFGEVLRTRWAHRLSPVTVTLGLVNLKIDIDACAKGTLDSLEGVVYDNDRQVQELHIVRHVLPGADPRLDITITAL